MSLIRVMAEFNCDECGRAFSVAMDPAENIPNGWSVYDLAEDAALGSIDYDDGRDLNIAFSSVDEDGKHLCADCTQKADQQDASTDTSREGDKP